MELAVQSLRSFLICNMIHTGLEYATGQLANTLTCCIFQLYFISKSAGHIYNEYYGLDLFMNIRSSTLILLFHAIGYFSYDLIYLWKKREAQWTLFIAHHTAALLMLFIMIHQGIKEVMYHNLVCFISEIINPTLNLRLALAQWFGRDSHIYQFNKKLIIVNYTVFRIIAFPIVAYKIAPYIHDTWALIIIYTLTIGLYGTSLMWYRKLIQNFITN